MTHTHDHTPIVAADEAPGYYEIMETAIRDTTSNDGPQECWRQGGPDPRVARSMIANTVSRTSIAPRV